MVVDGFRCLWVVSLVIVGGCGWLRVIVSDCGWLQMVMGGCIL